MKNLQLVQNAAVRVLDMGEDEILYFFHINILNKQGSCLFEMFIRDVNIPYRLDSTILS